MTSFYFSNPGADQQQVLKDVLKRSARDPEFRHLLLTRATETLQSVLPVRLPDGFRIQFIENAGADLTVVLPDREDEALSDAALDYVAGGGDAWIEDIEWGCMSDQEPPPMCNEDSL